MNPREAAMIVGEQVLLRIYLHNADRAPFEPTHEKIVRAARNHHLAGATVLKGILGAGYHGILKPSTWSLSEHVPVIIEIVDTSEKIADFCTNVLSQLMTGGMFTLERAAVAMIRTRKDQKIPASLAGEVQPLSTLPRFDPGVPMQIHENGMLLRVFIGESDRHEKKPLYEAVVQKVRELGLAGATVLRGTEGFGAHSVVHKSSLLEMSRDLPIVIEIIDAEEKIRQLLPHLDAMIYEGMITMEHVMIAAYRSGTPK